MANKVLNQDQLQAIKYGAGPILIIAGAGTGKTTVITERIKYLIQEELAKPSEILALTFTDKAAREMEERVDQLVPYGYTQMWISTFHAFADQVLRQQASQIGLDPHYRLMTEAETIQLVKNNLFKFKLKYFRPRGNPAKFLPGLINHFNRLRDEVVSPKQYSAWVKKQPAEVKPGYLELAQVYQQYQQLKAKDGLVDFADLVYYSLILFKTRKNILKQYQTKFKYILVDEFQDTNIGQNQLVTLLAGKKPNLTCVCDDDQSIYKWRGAAVANVLEFRKTYPQAKLITLTKNYRSTQTILDRAYQLIQFNNPDRLEVKEKIDKHLISQRQLKGQPIELICTDRVEAEAEQVVEKIKQLTQSEYQFKDMAILVRANNHAEAFIQALKRQGMPFQFLGPGQLFRQEEVKDLISYLYVLDDFENNLAFYRVLTLDIWDLPARDIAGLRNWARKNNLSFFEAAEQVDQIKTVSQAGQTKLVQIIKLIHQHLKLLKTETAGQILYRFLEASGWLAKLIDPQTAKQDQRIQNMAKFFDKLKNYEADHEDSSVLAVVDWLKLKLELGESPLATDLDWTEVNAVNLLTVHSAKGLEFPVVFLVNLVAERFPTRNRAEQIPIPDELIKEVLPEGDSHQQEERRLFYVGLTRARDQVFLTASKYYGEAKRVKKLSPFIQQTLPVDFKFSGQVSQSKPSDQLSFFDFKTNPEVSSNSQTSISTPLNYLSYSQIEAFKNCPLQYYYRYVLRLPVPPSHQQSFGISLHETMRDLYQRSVDGQKTTKVQLLKILKQNWLSQGYSSKQHEQNALTQARKYLTEFYNQAFDFKLKPLALESSFKIKLANDLWVGGRIDRIDKLADGSLEIVDYKTGSIIDQKRADKSLQMTIYALAATNPGIYKQAPEQVKLSFYFFDGQQKVTTTRTKAQLMTAKKEILDIRDQIQTSDFQAQSNYLCQFCDYKLLCPAN